MKHRLLFAFCLSASSLRPVHAQPLASVIEAALQHDADFLATETLKHQASALQQQANSLFKPSINASGSLGYGAMQTHMQGASFATPTMGTIAPADFSTHLEQAWAHHVSITATQSLYKPSERLNQTQLQQQAALVDWQYRGQYQQQVLHISDLYYQLALKETELTVLKQLQRTTQRQVNEAKYRFKVGDQPIVNTHEAEAQHAIIVAKITETEAQQRVLHNILTRKTALNPIQATLPTTLPVYPQRTVEEWLALAKPYHPELQLLYGQQRILAAEQQKNQWTSTLQVDAFAHIEQQRSTGNAYDTDGLNSQRQHMVGVRVSAPLYTGGRLNAHTAKAQADLDRVRSQTVQQEQQLTTDIATLLSQLDAAHAQETALNSAIKASQQRLASTQLGKQVGDRTLLEVMQAEQQLAELTLKHAQNHVAATLAYLKLKTLTEQQITLPTE